MIDTKTMSIGISKIDKLDESKVEGIITEEKQKIIDRIKELEMQLDNVHGTETEVYSRVVGYFQRVKGWNNGKQEEFRDRVMYKLPEEFQEMENKAIKKNENKD